MLGLVVARVPVYSPRSRRIRLPDGVDPQTAARFSVSGADLTAANFADAAVDGASLHAITCETATEPRLRPA